MIPALSALSNWFSDIDNVSLVFYVAIGLLFLIHVGRPLLFSEGVNEGAAKHQITNYIDLKPLMLGLGILGTFVGLYMALQPFREGTADGSITAKLPQVLPGVSLAFGTSIAGLLTNLLAAGLERIWIGSEPLTPEMAALSKLNTSVEDLPANLSQELLRQMNESLDSIKISIATTSAGMAQFRQDMQRTLDAWHAAQAGMTAISRSQAELVQEYVKMDTKVKERIQEVHAMQTNVSALSAMQLEQTKALLEAFDVFFKEGFLQRLNFFRKDGEVDKVVERLEESAEQLKKTLSRK